MLFIKIMEETFQSVINNRSDLSKALLLPFIAYLAIEFIEETEAEGFFKNLLLIFSSLIHTVFAISTHRIILLGKGSVPEWGLRSWGKRETFFLLHAVVLFGLTYLITSSSIKFSFISIILIPLGFIFILWLWARFSLVFPGIATGQDVSFKTSWHLTKNYQLLMLLIAVIFIILPASALMMLSHIPYSAVVINIISILVIVFEVSALSMVYQLITSEVNSVHDKNF